MLPTTRSLFGENGRSDVFLNHYKEMNMTQRWEQSETDEEDRRIYGASCQRWELIDYSRQDPQIVDTTFTTPEKKDQ